MWFLKHRPTEITIQALVASIDKGYQRTRLQFTLKAAYKMLIAIPFPWASHKPNGSFKLQKTGENIAESDFTLYEHLRDLKKIPDIELVNVQELCNWHLDDVGVAVCWVEPDTTYEIEYTHKIAADSCLFVPTRIPTMVTYAKPAINYSIQVQGGVAADLPPHVAIGERISESEFSLIFKDKWMWDTDTRIHTFNWESSDDEQEN